MRRAWQSLFPIGLRTMGVALIAAGVFLLFLSLNLPAGEEQPFLDVERSPLKFPEQYLLYAAHEGDLATVKRLVEAGVPADTKVSGCWDGDTPLIEAALCGHKEIVRFLIERGADVNARNDYGVTPLHAAIYPKRKDTRKEIVKTLLHRGAKVNTVGGIPGQTPLAIAFYVGDKEIISLLKQAGAKQ